MTKIFNESGVKFFHAGGGNWRFSLPTVQPYHFVSKSPNGQEGAVRIARILLGAVKRTKGQGVDGLARKLINQLIYS